jgi:bifunctional UDP-N-acetylglucosamine pyrophosphorylase/glucosamine-1-phosphate N-acetyltransferase
VHWIEQPVQLGTGDAVRQALPYLNTEQVLILYGDVPLLSLSMLDNFLQQTPQQALGILTAKVDNPLGLGRIVRNQVDEIIAIVEEQDATLAQRQITEVNTGIYLAPTHYLKACLPLLSQDNAQQEFYLTEIVAMAAAAPLPLCATLVEDPSDILGINNKVQLHQAERIYQQRYAQRLLKQGVTIFDMARFDVRGTLEAAPGCSIDINSIFEGHNVLGPDTHIGPNCWLRNCKIGQGVRILANSYLDSVTIGEQCQIGPFARLRPGTTLAKQVRVGNFVEIKNSTIDSGSKINHLNYIGDTTMGKAVNIGAGTITCNYDGVYKHQTIIHDKVLIGAGCQLIAPVMLGEGATLGAGSTLKKAAPAFALTLTYQLEQRVLPGWQRPKS